MSRAAITPTLGGGEQRRAGCFSLLEVLIAPDEIVVPTGDVRRPPFTAAVVKEEVIWGAVGTGGNDDTIPCEITKSLEPTCTIIQERIPLDKGRVESVCIIDKFLKVFISNR